MTKSPHPWNSPMEVSKNLSFCYDIGNNCGPLSILCHVVYATKGYTCFQQGCSTAGKLCGVSLFFQFGQQRISVVALNENLSIFNRTAGAAFAFESAGQGFQLIAVKLEARNCGHRFTFATFYFTPNPDYAVILYA